MLWIYPIIAKKQRSKISLHQSSVVFSFLEVSWPWIKYSMRQQLLLAPRICHLKLVGFGLLEIQDLDSLSRTWNYPYSFSCFSNCLVVYHWHFLGFQYCQFLQNSSCPGMWWLEKWSVRYLWPGVKFVHHWLINLIYR